MSQSTTLMIDEKGLLLYMLSLPHDWVLYRSNLYKSMPDAPGTIDRVFKSLQSKGYIISSKTVDEKGKFTGWDHVVYDEPQTRHEDLPMSGFTEVGESCPIQSNNSIQRDVFYTEDINTTSNMYSVLESSIVPILEKDEDFKNFDNNQKQSAMYIVQEMVKVYQKKNPDYFFDKETDYHACLQIVYKIAKMKNWGKMGALEGKMRECLASWDKISDFISNDKWLSTRSLSDISTVKEWQRLVNSMNAEKKSKPKISDYEKNRQEQLEKYRNKTTVPQ